MNKQFVLLLFLSASLSFSKPDDQSLLKGIELGIAEKYDAAILHFSQIKASFPNNPAAPFFLAAIYQSRMMDFETDLWKDQFWAELQAAERLAKQSIEKEPLAPDNYFYLGGALAYKSFQLGREGNYVSALTFAIKSVSNLKHARQLDSTFYDPFLGIGSYQYWKSRVTAKVNWLPFLSDTREEGIRRIERAVRCSKFSKWAAISNLAWIYIEEGDYDKAIKYSEMGLERFPGSRFFLWPLADALFKDQRFDEAVQVYSTILASITKEAFNNHYNEILLYYKIARSYWATGEKNRALEYCQIGLQIEPRRQVRKRADKIKSKLRQLLKNIENGRR